MDSLVLCLKHLICIGIVPGVLGLLVVPILVMDQCLLVYVRMLFR